MVEAQLGLREWSVRDREGERHRLKWEREKGERVLLKFKFGKLK